jgi:hypothetical protein
MLMAGLSVSRSCAAATISFLLLLFIGVSPASAVGPLERVSVLDFGAVGDGLADDTAAVANAIIMCAARKAVLFFPAGTYLLTRQATASSFLPLPSNTRIEGAGMGASIIRIQDGSGSYDSVFGAKYGVASDVFISGITIDQNSAGNPLVSEADTLAHPRFLISTARSANLAMHQVEALNLNGINSVYSGSTNTVIADCRFLGIGGGFVYHDHSTVYIAAEGAVVANNLFRSSGVNSAGAVAAIETHGGHHTITGNAIEGFEIGMNITGVTQAIDSEDITVAGNTIWKGYYGIEIWSQKYPGGVLHQTGYGISGLRVTGNSIRLNQTLWTTNAVNGAPMLGNPSGIFLNPRSTLPVKSLTISGNTVEFDLSVSASEPVIAAGFGIGYWDAMTGNTCEQLTITHNIVRNAPAVAIRFATGGADVEISNNQIVNPGSTLNPALQASYRTGILIANPLPVPGIRVLDNTIVDNLPDPRMRYGILVASPNPGDVVLSGNIVSSSGQSAPTTPNGPFGIRLQTVPGAVIQ